MMLHHPWITGIALLGLSSGTALPAQSAPTGAAHQRCPECPEMVAIHAGDFMMGMSPSGEKARLDTEGPVQRVHIRAFEVSKYPVTRGQWRMYAYATGHRTTKDCDWLDPGFPQDDTHPVVCVSWQDAQDYIVWLNKKSGQHFRLLTEAEYEYVNRAGTTTAYFWGDTDKDLALYANGNGKGTTPVGSFKPNAWGLFDTTGNVWSWTQDCWHRRYNGAPTDGRAWETGCDDSARVLRGGSWSINSWYLRSASRYSLDLAYNFVGARLARTP
jgi:formylglycine-generating enzyme required for sulfatase activity